ncbi:MAG: hypothetical protein FWD36_06385, partial [Treponema sp.]|nr:hypothetical protein [Treponema sp.]
MRKHLKLAVFFSITTLVILGLYGSCQNPFSNNLGSKVDVEPPTIRVESPKTGALLGGSVRFEGVATAYRDLRSVEVRIFYPDPEEGGDPWTGPALDWTSAGVTLIGSATEKNWIFDLDTSGLPEGTLRIRFRARDPSLTTETSELIYNVKNGASTVKLMVPDQESLDDPAKTPQLRVGSELRGQVIDRRGIKPEYPKIKIWLASDTEPMQETDWEQLFLSGIDNFAAGIWTTVDRDNMPVVRPIANFVFPLGTRGPGTYHFRIKTSDVYFYSEDIKDEDGNILHQQGYPRDPEDGEEEIVAFHPNMSGDAYEFRIISPTSELPRIELYTTGIPAAELAEPSIYITDRNSRKIAVDGARDNFRLRILASHSRSIASAALYCEDFAGPLAWDISAGEDIGSGTIFQFTANGNSLFTASPEPYTLRVTVEATDGSTTSQTFTLYLDKDGPAVSILSVQGALEQLGSVAEHSDSAAGVTIIDTPYTVNGNIQVMVDRSANFGIQQAKWIIEDYREMSAVKSDSDSIYSQLMRFRADPTAAGWQFFNGITETGNSGLVETVNRTNAFKFSTGSDRELWLYVIAQDNLHNLGFIMQKIVVNNDSDIPQIIVPGLADTTEIADADALKLTVGADRTITGDRRNVLERDQGIELNFTDDDGINRSEGITIALENLSDSTTRTIDIMNPSPMLQDPRAVGNVGKNWSGVLSQQRMAQAFGRTTMPDGMYRMTITVEDDVDSKVAIGGAVPAAVSAVREFFFAVHTAAPEITIVSPDENSLQRDQLVSINGTVRSRLDVQRLFIQYYPDIIDLTGNANNRNSEWIEIVLPSGTVSDGEYIYNWTTSVNFNPDGLNPLDDLRSFTLEAYDSLGYRNTRSRTVQVDSTPPEVELFEFNFGRLPSAGVYYVNGKVPFTITAWDLNGIKITDDLVHIKWFVLPASSPIPVWSTIPGANEAGGQFERSNSIGGGRYQAIFDSRDLTDGVVYILYAIAEDNADNYNIAEILRTFTVLQSSDEPVIESLSPINGQFRTNVGLSISGIAIDDDGFIAARAGEYVEIRFNGSGAWVPVPGTLDPTGEISFALAFESADFTTDSGRFGSYFNNDGIKQYQIRVTDEADNKSGIAAVTKIFPGDSTYYNFVLKTNAPSSTFGSNLPSRPRVSSQAELLAFLAGGSVADTHLETVSVLVNGIRMVTLYDETTSHGTYANDEFEWDLTGLPADWLAVEGKPLFGGAPEDRYDDGLITITIEAIDEAGNIARYPWAFYKDTKGPNISYNVDRIFLPDTSPLPLANIIRGNAGSVFLTGRFEDDYSNIRAANAAEYRFNDTGAWFPVSFTILENPRMARWSILIPGNAAYPDEPGYGPPSAANLPDGEHTIAIRVWDEHDNENIESGLRFIVDRRAPVLPLPEDIAVVVGTTDMGSLLEYARVFSADGLRHDSDEPVFTLKGTVRDHNLTRLHIAIYADDKETTAVYLEWDSNDPDSRLNITSAGNAYEWNWELEIQEQDLYALRNSSEVQALPPAEIDSNRYRIRISASDMALRDSPVRNWYFYLDDNEPDLVFFNLEPVEARPPVFESNDISLTGSAYDINRIREIKYRIAKYDYTVGAWRYRSNTAWTETAPVEWSVLVPANAATARRDVNWTLDRNNLSSTSSGRYPADLFAAEGQYRLELEVTDWSLGQGAGNAVEERRVFFVDRFDPVIDWGNTEPFYRNNADGEVIISFTASDANIIDENIVAVIQRPNGAGNYTIPASQIALGPIDFDSNPPGRLVTLRPVMAEGTTPWNAGAYTLVLTVKDMAGKTASAFETLNFILDNTPPAITVLPGSSTEAITGQVTLRGRFIKDRAISPVSRVAFYVAHNGNAFGPPAGYQSLSINTGTINDDAFDADLDQWFIDNAGWYFNTGSGSPSSLEINGNPAVTIDQGLATANITIPNLRFLNGTQYLRPWAAGTDPDVTYKGVTLGAGDVSQLVIYILAVDTAGNRLVHKYDYWVYPEGDRPVITSVINPDKTKIEEMRLLNGRIRISGTAADNIRVKNVYFRVIDDATDTPVTALRIPQWNSSWGALEEMQSPITIDPSTYLGITGHRAGNGGWFIANGGSSTNVPWWAFINTEGELDPEGSGARKITIEILVEDTIWDDVNGRWGGGWNGAGWDAPSAVNFFSSVEVVTAYVVKDAPEFADEIVLSNRSYTTLNGGLVAGTVIGNRTYRPDMIDFEAWKPMPPASMRKRASYAISVRNDSGVRAITYAGVNLLDPAELYNSTTYWTDLGRVDAGTFGIAVMAGPKALRLPGTLSDLGRDVGGDRGKTFLVWDPGNDGIHYTKFVYDGGTLPFTSASARLMEERFDNLGQLFFEWVIVADVNTEAGALNYTNTSILHPLSFSVTDYTEPVPLISTRPVSLRIDNLPPQIMYTHSSNIAGTSATFGGVAGDSGVVNGLEKVVLWFSREVDVPDVGRAERSVTWVRDNTFMPGTGPEGITLPTGVTFPFIPDENTSVSNWSCIVIDRNDPMGTQTRYGHRRPIGYATVGGVLSQSWYVTLDS